MARLEREIPLEFTTPLKERYPLAKHRKKILTLDAESGMFRNGDMRVGKLLSPYTLTILLHLMDSAGHEVGSDELFQILSPNYVNPFKFDVDRIIRSNICTLRRKLKAIDSHLPSAIHNTGHRAYSFKPDKSVAQWYRLDLRKLTHLSHAKNIAA